MTTTGTARTARPGRLRRWWWRLLLGGAIVAGLVAFSLSVLTSSWFIVWRATPVLETKLGGSVTIGSAQYLGQGRFALGQIRLRAPGTPGLPGEVLRVGAAIVSVDAKLLLLGQVHVLDVELDDVQLRLSEDGKDPGTFNWSALRRPPETRHEQRTLPPRVHIRRADIEMGVHTGPVYRMVGHRRVAGSMKPSDADARRYLYQLHETDERDQPVAPDGFALRGQWDAITFELWATMDGLQVDERTLDMCPSVVRFWTRHMDLDGRVAGATTHWRRGDPLQAELKLENVRLTLPLIDEHFWSAYRAGQLTSSAQRPRMRVASGTIRLSGQSLVLDNLQGELTGFKVGDELAAAPYRVHGTIAGIPLPENWGDSQHMDTLIRGAGFSMTMILEQLQINAQGDADGQYVVLPTQLAQVLRLFNLSQCSLESQVTISREPAVVDDEGHLVPREIRTTGTAHLRDGEGSYAKFDYPLEHVDARLSFDTDQLTIEELTAVGSKGAPVRISGTVVPPGMHPAVHLKLNASDVPLDDRLLGALPEQSRRAFETMFDRRADEARRQAGVMLDQAAIDAARLKRLDLMQDLVALTVERNPHEGRLQTELADVSRRIMQLERMIEAGPFELGGSVDLNLEINREPGQGQPVQITGRVNVDRAGFMHARFPYPIHVLSGAMDWQPDRILIVPHEHGDGMRLATPGGGVGMATGEIRLTRVDDELRVDPHLRIEVRDDHLNDLLYHAIPGDQSAVIDDDSRWAAVVDAGDSPLTRGGRLLKKLDLDATADYDGHVTTDESGRPTFSFDVTLRDGHVDPRHAVEEIAPARRLKWPEGMALEDVTGVVQITPDMVEIVDLVGHRGDGRVEASGRIGFGAADVPTQVQLRFVDLSLDEQVASAVASVEAGQIQALWQQFQPAGVFSAWLEFDATVPETLPRLLVQPRDFTLMLDDSPVTLRRSSGSLIVDDRGVDFRNLELSLERHPESTSNELDSAQPVIGINGRVDMTRGVSADLTIHHRAEELLPELRALLPKAVRESIDAIAFQADDWLEISNGRLQFDQQVDPDDPKAWRVEFDGEVRAQGASLKAGIGVTDLDGAGRLQIRHVPGEPAVLRIDGRAGSAMIDGRALSNLRIEVLSDGDHGLVLADLRADMGGGAVSAQARVGIRDNRNYAVDLDLVGVGLDSLATAAAVGTAESGADEPSVSPTGQVYGTLQIAGIRGDPARRRGSGAVRVMNGRLTRMPLTMALLQMLEFMPPLFPALNFADVQFYIDGDVAVAEQCELASPSVTLLGRGELRLDTMQVDARFRSRGNLVLISDLVTLVSDQLFEIELTGPLADPKARLIALPALSQAGASSGRGPAVRAAVGSESTP